MLVEGILEIEDPPEVTILVTRAQFMRPPLFFIMYYIQNEKKTHDKYNLLDLFKGLSGFVDSLLPDKAPSCSQVPILSSHLPNVEKSSEGVRFRFVIPLPHSSS